MFSLWKISDLNPKADRSPPPRHWVNTVEEVAALVGDRVEWLREQLSRRSYLVTRGWHIEPNT